MPGDPHVEAVEAALRQRGVTYHLYDPRTFPAASRLSLTVNCHGSSAFLRWNNTTLRLNEVTAVWDRSNAFTHRLTPVKKDLRSYVAAESQTFLDGLYYLMPQAFWISDPIRSRIANAKPRQLQLAAELGFTIPDTYMGNDPEIARELVNRHDTLAFKVIHRKLIEYELTPLHKLRKAIHDFRHRKLFRECADAPVLLEHLEYRHEATLLTHRCTPAEVGPLLEALPAAPVIVQEYVSKKLELRITVVGSHVFPCAIYSQEGAEASRVDWRNDTDALRHEAYALPAEVEEKCLALIRRLGLQFGAIDMIVTPQNEYMFLENNANGQWLWVRNKAGLPIAEALANLLIMHNG